MDKKALERRCLDKFGRITGRKLFNAMIKIHEADFCVATAWDEHQVSIAISCRKRGILFELTPDYQELIMPDGTKLPIDKLEYTAINKYLPENIIAGEIEHCYFDRHPPETEI